MKSKLTQQRLKELVHYDPETGVFTALVSRKRVAVGDKVGSSDSRGYLKTYIDGSSYYLHRLAFLYMNGVLPEQQVDHRDGNTSNNSFTNLREADAIKNGRNRKIDARSTTRVTGVCLLKTTGKYRAHIKLQDRRVVLGCFEMFDDAVKARKDAELKYFGEACR